MNTVTARVLTWAGLALLAVGLLVGLLPVTADGVGCGSVLHASSEPWGATADRCDDKRSTGRLVVWPLLLLGGVGAVGGGLAWSDAVKDERYHEQWG